MLSRTIVCLMCIAALAMMGCGKKEKNKTTSLLTQMPKAAETSTAPKDSADIFNEFYDGNGAKTKSAPATKNDATFSTASSATSTQFVPDGRYVVQVSCVLSRSLADKNVKKLEEKGYPAYVAEVSNPTASLTGTYYRVRIGGFKGISQAKEFGESSLVPGGYEYWVDNRSNDNVGLSGAGLGSSSTESSYSTPAPSSGASSWGSSSSSSTSSGTSTTSSSDWGSSSTPATTPAPAATSPEPAPSASTGTGTANSGSTSAATSSTGSGSTGSTPSGTEKGSNDWSNDSAW
jgi:hypothetical protein